jgi:hypothetical protein
MAEPKQERRSLREFNAYADREGENAGRDPEIDLPRAGETQRRMASDPSAEGEIARLASDQSRQDSIKGGSIATSEATAAETPAENIERISDPRIGGGASPSAGKK